MKAKILLTALAALILAAAVFFWHQDHEYRLLHGRVTEVGLLSWDQEVDNDVSGKPVLVYFYKEGQENADQDKVVHEFAWDHAYDVKVVAVNCSHVENFPLALGHGVLRFPTFVVVAGDKEVTGASGGMSSEAELNRLLAELKAAPAPAVTKP